MLVSKVFHNIQGKMENHRIGYQKLLVARSDKGHKEIHRGIQPMPKDEEQDGRDGRKAKVKQSTGEAMNLPNSRLHHEVTYSSKKGCNPGGL